MKTEVLKAIREARLSHNSWKSYAHLIAKGVVDDEKFNNMTPLVPTECGFGKWYFTEGVVLSKFSSYKNIEAPHEKIHDIYADIYKLIHEKVKTGWFQSKKSAEERRDKEVDALLEKMDEQVELLLEHLDKLEKDVSNLTAAELYNKLK